MSASSDPSSDAVAPSQAVIEAIAAHEGVDVTDVEPPAYEPLYAVVNPEALDRLFQPAAGSTTARVVLEYEGYEITVSSDGRVDVNDRSVADGSIEFSLED
ncbi:hypothetical protein HTZ84_06945 [Haloterrigena sp. SYSU A558-1]|uniref:Halobacterial output domain-containing protein n=1 Tax=Haloterrigena gelatinilytica TaxID=2741724 RepID=A0A8J8KC71_9EURY|nr:HalOD1 output domain-containing protein [Haloterrigena gelatinilytica]NUB92125.1 hypothetical protein [Haloterrigena gelatinilytica]NUC72045.1 hypothetical protein [Haloterrigena gelatinilytica]